MTEILPLAAVPSIISAAFAYLIARKRNIVSERVNKSKIDADAQVQALNIVRAVMDDMRKELKSEIEDVKNENQQLRVKLDSLQSQLEASDELISTLRNEIASLHATIKLYEQEIHRLQNK